MRRRGPRRHLSSRRADQDSVVGVIGSSIGSAAAIYLLVAITGYLTFGSKVVGNIVSMCKSPASPGVEIRHS